MYYTGTLNTFSSRIHQFYTGDNQYVLEARSYIDAGLVTKNLSGHWETEMRRGLYRATHSGIYLNTQQIT